LGLIEVEEGRRDALNSGMQDLRNVVTVPLDGLAIPQRLPVIERELASTRQAQFAFDSLASQLPLLERQSVEWATSKLSACILGFERAKHAIEGEHQAQTGIKSKIDEHENAKKTLESTKAERGRLEKACKVLSALIEQASLDQMTAQAFASIRNKVSSIFARIHTPSEYELGEFSSGSLVIRRDGHAAHQVQQVSTGQRAALALSIFLALNDSAHSAPPVMLIDDPVAHVDDLNALSFLDYLREVALHGKRQIFFATADVRLAALFQRKFEFLGRDHFRKIVLPREKTVGS
jgi:chromosome segregation protein